MGLGAAGVALDVSQRDMAVVVKTVLGSHFGVFGAPPIFVYFSGD